MGGNPAENHPCGFKWAIEAKKTRSAKLVAVDPRFTRTAAVADLYSPIRSGTDIAYLLGIIRYAIEKKRYHEEYVKLHTNAAYVIGDKFGFDDGLFSGFDEKDDYDKAAWGYEADPKTKAYGVDATLENPRCVFQLLKKHVDRYTPEMVERICGVPEGDVPQGRRDRHLDRQRPEGRHDHVRPRLDPALHGRPDDPGRGDAPAPARQRRPARRRRERAARPLEHPGRDRHGRHTRDPPRLPEDARRGPDDLEDYLEQPRRPRSTSRRGRR